MTKQDILKSIYNQLRITGAIRNKQDFAEKIGYNYTCTSSALNGTERYLNDRFFTRILRAFPQVREEYIRTGEGDIMVNSTAQGDKIESPSTGIHPLSSSSPITIILGKILSALAEQQELTRRQQAQTEKVLDEIEILIEHIRTMSKTSQ